MHQKLNPASLDKKLESFVVDVLLKQNKCLTISNKRQSHIHSYGVVSMEPLQSYLGTASEKSASQDRMTVYFNSIKLRDKRGELSSLPVSYFAIFDSEGSSLCANFFKERLHKKIFANKQFPKNLTLAIKGGIQSCLKGYFSYR